MFILFKVLLVPLWFVALALAERLAPASPALPPKRMVRNLGLWLCTVALSPLLVLPVTFFAAHNSLNWRPDFFYSGWGLVLDIIILDLWIWAWHRANHEVPFLWRFHEVHHLDETLDVTTALRFHFGEVALSAFVRGAFIFLLGIPLGVVVIFETLVLLAAIFHHSNLRLPPRLENILSKVFITPSIHWVHHHAVRSDTDSRYGTIFSFWDGLFSTTTDSVRLKEMPIGVAGVSGDRSFLLLLARPFLRSDLKDKGRVSVRGEI